MLLFDSWPVPELTLDLADRYGIMVQSEAPGIALRGGWVRLSARLVLRSLCRRRSARGRTLRKPGRDNTPAISYSSAAIDSATTHGFVAALCSHKPHNKQCSTKEMTCRSIRQG